MEHGSQWVAARDVIGLLRAAGKDAAPEPPQAEEPLQSEQRAGPMEPPLCERPPHVEGAGTPAPAIAQASRHGARNRRILSALAVMCVVGVLTAGVWALMSVLVSAARSTDPSKWAELEHDFRNRQFDTRRLRILGPKDCLSPGEKGLSITIPAGKINVNTGVSPNKQLVGDFEITAAFEILEIPKPKAGHGVGAALLINDQVPPWSNFPDGAPAGRSENVCRASLGADGGWRDQERVPCVSDEGRLGIVAPYPARIEAHLLGRGGKR